jgi:DNA-directed RNA polymerase subunit H (RpoH/RPB5)
MYKLQKSPNEIKKIVLTNIITMLTNRNSLDKKDIGKSIKELLTSDNENIYKISTIKDGDNYIFYYPYRVTSVSKTSDIHNFLNTYKNYHKITIFKEISKKAIDHIKNNYGKFSKVEIFLEEELMIDLVSYILVPKHIVLSPKEIEEVYKKYNCDKKQIPLMLKNDPIAKYYNLSSGDVCRIIRPSITSGESISYRMVK